MTDHTASAGRVHTTSQSSDQSFGSSGNESPTGLEILLSPTGSKVEAPSREEPPEKRRRLFPDSLATVGSSLSRTNPHETPATARWASSPTRSVSDEHGVRPEKTSAPANESIAEALSLIRHLMADKIPEDEPTLLTETGTASLLAADIDETLSADSEGFITLPLSQAVKAAVQINLKDTTLLLSLLVREGGRISLPLRLRILIRCSYNNCLRRSRGFAT